MIKGLGSYNTAFLYEMPILQLKNFDFFIKAQISNLEPWIYFEKAENVCLRS